MSHTPSSNPVSGISITGLLLGVIVEKSRDNQFTNYRMGIQTDSRPDKFGQVTSISNDIELTEQQYQRLSVSINSNLRSPVRIWLDVDHRAGEKNGRVWEMLNFRMRTDSEIEYLNLTKAAALSTASALPDSVQKSGK